MKNMDIDNKKNRQIECNDNDVISFGENTFRIERLKTAVNKSSNQELAYRLNNHLNSQQVNIQQSNADFANWFEEGVDCEILTLGANEWRKGKMKFKLSVEFYVEAEETINNDTTTESPLDEIRRKLDGMTS
jgi:hypothetical protein